MRWLFAGCGVAILAGVALVLWQPPARAFLDTPAGFFSSGAAPQKSCVATPIGTNCQITNPSYYPVLDEEWQTAGTAGFPCNGSQSGCVNSKYWLVPNNTADISYDCPTDCNGDSATYEGTNVKLDGTYAELDVSSLGGSSYGTASISNYETFEFQVPYYLEWRGRLFQSGGSTAQGLSGQMYSTSPTFSAGGTCCEVDTGENNGTYSTQYNVNYWTAGDASQSPAYYTGQTYTNACHVFGVWVQPYPAGVEWLLDGNVIRSASSLWSSNGPSTGTETIMLLLSTVSAETISGYNESGIAITGNTTFPNPVLVSKYVHVYSTGGTQVTPAAGYGGPGDANPAYNCASESTIDITGISLEAANSTPNQSFVADTPSGTTISSIVVAATGGGFTGSLSLSTTGACSSAANNSDFQISGGDLESNSGSLAAGSYTIGILASQGSSSLCVPFTITALPSGYFVSTSGSDSNSGTLAAPFATLTKCQTAMRSTPAYCYIRSGSYSPSSVSNCDGQGNDCAVSLSSSDDGETWSYYPPDGWDSASITGGATAQGNGLFYIFYHSNINPLVINGLTLHHADFAMIGSLGGSSNVTVENNVLHDQYYGSGSDSDAAPFMCIGCNNTLIENNVFYNAAGGGITFAVSSSTSLKVENNVLYNICSAVSDCGAIYQYVGSGGCHTSGTVIENNYMNMMSAGGGGEGVYLDDGTCNVTAEYNVTVQNKQNCALIHGANNDVFKYNVCDLSGAGTTTSVDIVFYQQDSLGNEMTGNEWESNIVVCDANNTCGGGYVGSNSPPNPMTTTDNLYYNYGTGGAVNHTGTGGTNTDADPTYANPLLSGWGPTLGASSPAYNSPVSWSQNIPGGWGPPGYAIPVSGITPSWQ